MRVCLGLVAMLSWACSEPYECQGCPDRPEAVPADDGKPSGIYKGVYANSEANTSGVLRIEIATDHSSGSAVATGDGTDIEADDSFSVDDQGEEIVFQFIGDKIDIELILDTSLGSVRAIEMAIDGEDQKVTVDKEDSDALVQCYVGTWEGKEDNDPESEAFEGYWNYLLKEGDIQGMYGGYSSGGLCGALSNERVELWDFGSTGDPARCDEFDSGDEGDPLASGKQNGERASGSWSMYDLYSGTWTGTREY